MDIAFGCCLWFVVASGGLLFAGLLLNFLMTPKKDLMVKIDSIHSD